MFSRTIDDKTHVSLAVPQFADELFRLTDKNRAFLRRWLLWLDGVKKAGDTESFIKGELAKFARGEALTETVLHEGRIAGVLGFNSIERSNRIGYIGYWLGEEFNGRGIMTACVRDLISLGTEYYSLERFDIRCAVQNEKSRAIPERLRFSEECTLRRAEKVNDSWYDHVVYGLLVNQHNEEGSSSGKGDARRNEHQHPTLNVQHPTSK